MGKTKIQWITRMALVPSIIAGFIGVFVTFTSLLSIRPSKDPTSELAMKLQVEIEDSNTLKTKYLKYQEYVDDIKLELLTLKTTDSTTEVGAQIALIHVDIVALSSRMKSLEDALLENPEKALAIPLMRKDMKQIEDAHKQSVATMVRSIDRIYDQNKWFIGTMALGLITLAISSFVQTRQKL